MNLKEFRTKLGHVYLIDEILYNLLKLTWNIE